ncbi:LysR family transcriptional regulator [Rhodobacteraceae bacterium NNCM2]|nr:LysR family transcriptional regulator [Coraliihabitans acroporae]
MSLRHIPSLNWLRVFEAAARTGSFARAADVLNMSPPAVSQQIKALEGYLGKPLFERGARNVALTEAGKTFLPTVSRSLHAIEVASDNLFGESDRQPLSIQCSAMMMSGWLIPRLGRFRELFPGVQLTLSSEILADEAARPGVDMRISFGLPSDIRGEADLLFGERVYPVALPRIASMISKPSDLANHTLLEITTHRTNWSAILPSDGPDPTFLYSDMTINTLALAAAEQGIALARAPATDGLVAHYGLVPCLPGIDVVGTHSYYLSYPALSGLSTAAQAFRDWLLTEVTAP